MRHLNLIFFSPNPLTMSHLGGSYSFIYSPPVINGSIILAVSVHPVVTPVVGSVCSLDLFLPLSRKRSTGVLMS